MYPRWLCTVTLTLSLFVLTIVAYPSSGPCDVSPTSLTNFQNAAAGAYSQVNIAAFTLSVLSSTTSTPTTPSSSSMSSSTMTISTGTSSASFGSSSLSSAPSSTAANSGSAATSSATSMPTSSAFSTSSRTAMSTSSFSTATSVTMPASSSTSSAPSSSAAGTSVTSSSSLTASNYSSSSLSSSMSGSSTGSSGSSSSSSGSGAMMSSVVSSYVDFANYTVLLSINASANSFLVSTYLPVTGWLLYATSVDYTPGTLSLNMSSSTWQTLSTATNSQCTNVGVVDGNPSSGGSLTYTMPLSVQWTAPSNVSGNVTLNALVLTQNQFFFTVLSLVIPPAVTPPTLSPPQSYVGCNASTDGMGDMTFVCWFSGNDGGAFVSYIAMSVYPSSDSMSPIAGMSQPTSPVGRYPTYASFTFALTVGQTYSFQMYAGNSVGRSALVNTTTLTATQQSQSTSLPVSASGATISAGGVFGIVVGCLAAIGLIFLATRFYTRKGHLRQHMRHINQVDHEAEEGEQAAEDDVELGEEADEDEDEEAALAADARVDEGDEDEAEDLEQQADEHSRQERGRAHG